VRCVFSVFGGYSTKKKGRDIQGHHPENECEPYEKSVKTKNNIAHCGQKDLGRSGTSREGQQQKKTGVKKHQHQEQTKKTTISPSNTRLLLERRKKGSFGLFSGFVFLPAARVVLFLRLTYSPRKPVSTTLSPTSAHDHVGDVRTKLANVLRASVVNK